MATSVSYRLNISGPQGTQIFVIPEGITILGRMPDCDLVLPHAMISRKHAQIDFSQNECQIMDLGSANGTVVNGTALTAQVPCPIGAGSSIRMGPFEMVVELVPVQDEPPKVEIKREDPLSEALSKKDPDPLEKKAEDPLFRLEALPLAPPPDHMVPPGFGEDNFQIPPGLSYYSLRLLKYLPPIYHTDFMSRFLALFESILLPVEWTIDHFDLFLAPGTAPAGFLPWLAGWFTILFDDSWTDAQRRQFLDQAGAIYSRLGTKWALSTMLEIYTGCSPKIIEFEDGLAPHTFRVLLPSNGHVLRRDLIEQLIDANKPAYTLYQLEIQP